MSWFKVDDGFHCHPKALAAGNAALGLWTRLGAYSSDQLLDGFVPAAIARAYGTRSEVKALVNVRLLEAADHPEHGPGYVLHDFHDYNPTADTVRAARDAAAERQRRWRERHHAEKTTERNAPRNAVSSPSPTRPDPTRPEEEPLHLKHEDTRGPVDIAAWSTRRKLA